MKKYGLQLSVQPSQKKQATRPSLPPPQGFRDDDDDDDNVERDISRHAIKNKTLKDIEEQHKKALEQDPSVFDYDGVYDEMKEDIVRPRVENRQERKVTKKSDISDFYFNLSKNVAFGAEGVKSRGAEKNEEKETGPSEEVVPSIKSPLDSSRAKEVLQGETSISSSKSLESLHEKPLAHTQDSPVMDTSVQERGSAEQPIADQPKTGHHKRNDDALAAAKERFLARRRAMEQ